MSKADRTRELVNGRLTLVRGSTGRGVDHGHSLSPGGIDAQNRPFSGTTTDIDSFTAGLGGLLPSGLTYDLGSDFSDSTGTAPTGPFENTGGSVAVQLRQP